MLLIDPRAGSKELIPYLSPYDIEFQTAQLEFGDIAFMANGKDGAVTVGIELKTIHDLVASIRSKRLSGHQLPGMCETYDVLYLCVQGVWRCGPSGEVEVLAGRGWVPLRLGSSSILYREVSNYLTTLEQVCGLDVVRTNNHAETAAWVVGLAAWWSKPWDKHNSHEAIYSPDPVRKGQRRASFMPRKVGAVAKVASCLPGIDNKAFEFEKKFKTVEQMVTAGVKDLQKVEGVGKVGAEKIHKWLRGG